MSSLRVATVVTSALLLSSALVLSGACSSSSGNGSGGNGSGSGSGGGTRNSLTQSFGPSGGNLLGPSGFTLTVPAGALASSVNVTVSGLGSSSYPSNMPTIPSAWTLQSLVYEFQPSGQTFAKPVSIGLPYSGASGAFVGTAEPSGSWSTASGASFGSSLATLSTSHFSFYGVFTTGGSFGSGGGQGDGGAAQPCADGCTNSAGSCVDNVCTCPTGYTTCNNVCVNTELDDMNCGGCGIACAESCTQGECVVTLSSSESAIAVAVDSSALYWANSSGSIVKVAIAGGTPVTLASSLNAPGGIALDSSNVYFTLGNGNVESIPKAGGSPLTIASGQTGVLGVAVSNGHVYWAASDGDLVYKVWTVPVAGAGGASLVAEASGAALALAVDSHNVYWTTKTGLFSASLSTIGKFDGGSPVTSLGTSGGNGVAALAIDSSEAYWGTFAPGTGTVQKVALTGGSTTQLASGQYGPNGLAVDGASIYWTTQEGLVLKLPVAGGTPSTLASVSNGGTGIVVDSTSVYWASGNTVQKITPK